MAESREVETVGVALVGEGKERGTEPAGPEEEDEETGTGTESAGRSNVLWWIVPCGVVTAEASETAAASSSSPATSKALETSWKEGKEGQGQPRTK